MDTMWGNSPQKRETVKGENERAKMYGVGGEGGKTPQGRGEEQ